MPDTNEEMDDDLPPVKDGIVVTEKTICLMAAIIISGSDHPHTDKKIDDAVNTARKIVDKVLDV